MLSTSRIQARVVRYGRQYKHVYILGESSHDTLIGEITNVDLSLMSCYIINYFPSTLFIILRYTKLKAMKYMEPNANMHKPILLKEYKGEPSFS